MLIIQRVLRQHIMFIRLFFYPLYSPSPQILRPLWAFLSPMQSLPLSERIFTSSRRRYLKTSVLGDMPKRSYLLKERGRTLPDAPWRWLRCCAKHVIPKWSCLVGSIMILISQMGMLRHTAICWKCHSVERLNQNSNLIEGLQSPGGPLEAAALPLQQALILETARVGVELGWGET